MLDRKNGLVLGWHLDSPDVEVRVGPQHAAQHTAVLAQSGAGKSFFIGRLVEELLINTRARVVVLDVNGDFRRCDQLNASAWAARPEGDPWPRVTSTDFRSADEFADRWRAVRLRHVTTRCPWPRPEPGGEYAALWIDWGSLSYRNQAYFLGFDPAVDATEACWLQVGTQYAKRYMKAGPRVPMHAQRQAILGLNPNFFAECVAEGAGLAQEGLHKREPVPAYVEPSRQRVHVALDALARWPVWGPGSASEPSLAAMLAGGGSAWDLLVVDLASLEHRGCATAVVAHVLHCIWEGAREAWHGATVSNAPDTRVPLFIVVDEAQNFAPDTPAEGIEERVAAQLSRIGAEGRKYGLYVLLATQRPSKVRGGLLAECENVCLLRIQSPVEHRVAADTWGVPLEEVVRTKHLRKGDGLLLGRWVPSTTPFHAAWRRTQEGGASLDPEHWAVPRVLGPYAEQETDA